MFWLIGKLHSQGVVTSEGSDYNKLMLKGTEAPETNDTEYHSGHREFV